MKNLEKVYGPLKDKNGNMVLHLARSLDQYYYTSLTEHEVNSRDKDQVIYRFHAKKSIPGRRIIMVKQLWLWKVDTSMYKRQLFDFKNTRL